MATTTKKTAKVSADTITGYCMKTKEKNVPLQDCVIDIKGGRYIAKGHDDQDNKITCIVNAAKAEAAIAAGTAEKGEGWEKSTKKKK